ncbi:class I adenylate-forming enzyme family protein [Nocardiopsis coralliicola]
MQTAADPILDALSTDPARLALRDPRDAFTAGEAADAVHRLVRALADWGAGPGSVVALAGPVSARMYLLSLAVGRTGAAQVEIPVQMAAADQAALAAECRATHAVLDTVSTAEGTAGALAAAVPRTAVLGPEPAESSLFTAAAGFSAEPLPSRARQGDPDRIVLTGGTTGRAKPALRRHRARRPGGGWIGPLLAGGPVRLLKTDRFTGLGRHLGDAALRHGGAFHALPEFTPQAFVDLAGEQRITHAVIAPHQLAALLDHGADRSVVPDLRCLLVATAATGPGLLRRAVDAFGPVVLPSYGQTEAGHIAVLGPDDYASGGSAVLRSCGRPVSGAEVEVRDAEGCCVPAGERGRIWVRTSILMDEYLGRPADTARVLRGGWLDTGDVGVLDERGLLTVLGRSGDAIALGGRTVYPAEVDAVLLDHPDVREAATFGAPGPAAPGAPRTVLHTAAALHRESSATADGLREFLAGRLDPDLVPRSVLLLPELPLTYAHEPCRATLRRRAGAGPGALPAGAQPEAAPQS